MNNIKLLGRTQGWNIYTTGNNTYTSHLEIKMISMFARNVCDVVIMRVCSMYGCKEKERFE